MKDLACQLSDATAAALESLTSDSSCAVVKPADRRDLADFQCNGALALAKSLKRKPQEIAAAVADRWAAAALAERPTVAGPGFLNLRVTNDALAARAEAIASDERCGAGTVVTPRRVVVDYGGPISQSRCMWATCARSSSARA